MRRGLCSRVRGRESRAQALGPGGMAGVAALRAQLAEAGLGPQPSPPPLFHVPPEPPLCCAESALAGQRGGGCGQRGARRGWDGERREGAGAQTQGGKWVAEGEREPLAPSLAPPVSCRCKVAHRWFGVRGVCGGEWKKHPHPVAYEKGGALKTTQEVVYRLSSTSSPATSFF